MAEVIWCTECIAHAGDKRFRAENDTDWRECIRIGCLVPFQVAYFMRFRFCPDCARALGRCWACGARIDAKGVRILPPLRLAPPLQNLKKTA